MAVYEGVYHIDWLDSDPTDPAAPTSAEIEGGTDLTDFVTKDGVNPSITNNRVDKASIADTFDAQVMGSWGAQLAITFFKERAGETTAYDELGSRGVTGCVIITPGGAAASSGEAYVYPSVETGTPVFPASASNEEQKFTVEFASELAPVLDAVIDGGS